MPHSSTTSCFSIWSNAGLDAASALQQHEIEPHKLVGEDEFEQAEIAFGQPGPERVLSSSRLRWVHITSAGYTPYDTPEVRRALREKKIVFTNSSHVYDEPCAQHVMAMMLGLSRGLLACYDAQKEKRDWESGRVRAHSELLLGQTVLLLGFGAIAVRLVQMLRPFDMRLMALRQKARGDEDVEIVTREELPHVLPLADHVVNVLPLNEATRGLVNAEFLRAMKRGARFYNVGRGLMVDQDALLQSLSSGHLGAAYLDVTEPEPLPPDHALWRVPNCFITPHSAGGHRGEAARLTQHFLSNLRAWEAGEPLRDRVLD